MPVQTTQTRLADINQSLRRIEGKLDELKEILKALQPPPDGDGGRRTP